ncbi:MAG: hypothetical protein IPH85_05120 [Ignavibacteria bacterium]|nr:hypothetical protein [Ignavibacteria bacterium]MBP6509097.1 hypothetical protein [Candidatus Kapabacteria bacterium]MBK7034023.1 hypothetical protein [Ignavibacteria bacterium]MBK7185300.1 hypothetical protein [Ignavibacteria bacterium]MBK7411982.1 hypothetical protein [Ignavibacteria bacterium]
MRSIAIFLMLCLMSLSSAAQGFDWQTSPRVPYHIPKQYVGLEVGSGYTMHRGSLEYIEQEVGITCCDYEAGRGLPLTVSVVGEQWLSASVSAQAGIGFTLVNASFVTPSIPVPLSNGDLLQTEYILEGAMTYVTIHGGIGTRLFGTHLTAGGGVRLHVYAGGSLTQKERVVAPDYYLFTQNPRSKEQELGNTFLDFVNRFQIEPYAQIAYDISITKGFYLSPSVSIGMPLFSVTSQDDWRMLNFGARIRLMKGL